jgi:hypothetical protein
LKALLHPHSYLEQAFLGNASTHSKYSSTATMQCYSSSLLPEHRLSTKLGVFLCYLRGYSLAFGLVQNMGTFDSIEDLPTLILLGRAVRIAMSERQGVACL